MSLNEGNDDANEGRGEKLDAVGERVHCYRGCVAYSAPEAVE
jgi:hypothetical protein